jgi:regulator of protease activity HflC (stomatin/prohibitin superfamily)
MTQAVNLLEFLDIGFLVLFGSFVLFVLSSISKATYIVQQAEVVIIERLGKFHSILRPGIHFVVPFIDAPHTVSWSFLKQDPTGSRVFRYTKEMSRLDMREAVYDFPKQNVITKDNVTMEINALLYYQITDPKMAIYEINNLPEAIEKLTQTKLRDVIGALDLDETLISRDRINTQLRVTLDEATDKWGVKVNRVELQEVTPPHDIRVAMEKQMRAERDKRALILEAEGEKQSAILHAEGKKGAAILDAEGEQEAQLARAEGEAKAKIVIANAEATTINMITEALPGRDPVQYIVATNYIKALPEMTKGKNNKLILLPYEASSLAGAVSGIKEIFQHENSDVVDSETKKSSLKKVEQFLGKAINKNGSKK